MGNELRKDTKTGFDSPPPTFSVRFYAPGLKSPSKFLRLFLGEMCQTATSQKHKTKRHLR